MARFWDYTEHNKRAGRNKMKCPDCEGYGHGKQFKRVTNLGFMGIHETDTCPTSRGSGKLKAQWVADD